MKIGILTFHCAHNYGAVLQAYALQEKLKEMGADVQVIDYRPDYILNTYTTRFGFVQGGLIANIKNIFAYLLLYPFKALRARIFNKFINKQLILTKRVKNSIPDDFDFYVFGSDQIWNTDITKGVDNVFWGNFKVKNNAKKITYAASKGEAMYDNEHFKVIIKSLKNFTNISCREEELINIIQPYGDKEMLLSVDPAFILSRKRWEALAINPQNKSKYVLIYQVRSDNKTYQLANNIAHQLNANVIEVPSWIYWEYYGNKYIATSPFEFIGLIKNAECIITTSFHGVAFSLIFNRNFYAIDVTNGHDKRIINLLKSLNLSDRILNDFKDIKFTPINFEEPNKLLSTQIQNSINYLKNAIGDI